MQDENGKKNMETKACTYVTVQNQKEKHLGSDRQKSTGSTLGLGTETGYLSMDRWKKDKRGLDTGWVGRVEQKSALLALEVLSQTPQSLQNVSLFRRDCFTGRHF